MVLTGSGRLAVTVEWVVILGLYESYMINSYMIHMDSYEFIWIHI